MYENIKVLVADIDLTLRVGTGMPERTANTIMELRNKGYLFGLASGRPVSDCIELYERWGINEQFDFIIGWNGCQLYDNKTKELHKYNYLAKEDIKEIIELMRPYNTVVSIYRPGIYLCNQATERAMFSAWKVNREFIVTKSDEEFYSEECGGIMFRTTAEMMPTIEKGIAEKIKDKNYVAFKTQPHLMEFSNKNCSKGYAFMKYCELYNYSLDDCMAFGDTTNDNEMLKCCHGICLLNGSDDTKACAERITDIDCEHEGWADFVERYLLKK